MLSMKVTSWTLGKHCSNLNAFKNIRFGQLRAPAQLPIDILCFFPSPQSVIRNISSIS